MTCAKEPPRPNIEDDMTTNQMPIATGKVVAKHLRKRFKREFPGTKFSIRSSYNSVDVRWLDGPDWETIERILRTFEYGWFDAMHDIYEYTNPTVEIDGVLHSTGVKYAFPHREISALAALEVLPKIAEKFAIPEALLPTIEAAGDGSFSTVYNEKANEAARQIPGRFWDWSEVIRAAIKKDFPFKDI